MSLNNNTLLIFWFGFIAGRGFKVINNFIEAYCYSSTLGYVTVKHI